MLGLSKARDIGAGVIEGGEGAALFLADLARDGVIRPIKVRVSGHTEVGDCWKAQLRRPARACAASASAMP